MSTVETPFKSDDPLMIAWNEYTETDGYKNSRKWADDPKHVDGSLWAMSRDGYLLGVQKSTQNDL